MDLREWAYAGFEEKQIKLQETNIISNVRFVNTIESRRNGEDVQ